MDCLSLITRCFKLNRVKFICKGNLKGVLEATQNSIKKGERRIELLSLYYGLPPIEGDDFEGYAERSAILDFFEQHEIKILRIAIVKAFNGD
jgi:hypothetical protein